MKHLNPVQSLLDPCSPTANSLGEMAGGLILRFAGEDLAREGLLRTPQRFSKALEELTAGYKLTAEEVVGSGVFAAEGSGLVSVRDVEFYSLCEHHMLPFWGKASVAYYPDEKIVGLSKIPRLVDMFARRFQVQERLTEQVGRSLHQLLRPRAVAVRISAAHMCMMMRGVKKQSSETTTEFSLGLDRLSAMESERLWKCLD